MSRHELTENIYVALDTLRARKGRSALTLLGVVIGVTSVISVAAIITGLNSFIQQRVEALGSRTYFVSRIPLGPQNFGRLSEKLRKRRYFEYDYPMRLRERCPSLDIVTIFGTRAAFFGQSNEIRYGNERVERVFVRGTTPDYVDALPLFEIAQGRFISQTDVDHARPVVVIGLAIADSLFPTTDPIGKQVYLNGKVYEVIGVFARDSGFFGGPGVDQFAIVPVSDFKKNYPEAKELIMAITVRRNVDIQKGLDELADALRRIRRVTFHQEDDFEITSPDFISSLWNQLTGALVILTGIVSSVGLVVGGIGVMNIMLISVTERTQEIGIRKAIGARRADIRAQFLLEAIILTVSGGLIGIALGWLVAFLVRTLIPSVPATLSYEWVALGVLMSVGVGLFFGYYPANRAAHLDPIVCLRYE
ncbi:MAG: ABC transporter permease [Bryobacteraceae bacterium]|nr:ABC transporter permease [Bryobacteraceae bacterium]